MTALLLVLAWLLCGVLAVLVGARGGYSEAVVLTAPLVVITGPGFWIVALFLKSQEWLARYAARHRR